MANAPWQGDNLVEIFTITSDATSTTSTFTFDATVDSAIEGHPSKNSVKLTLTNKIDDPDFETFLESYLTDKEVTTNKLTYEDGTTETIVSGVDSSKTFAFIAYRGEVGTKRKVLYGYGVLVGATGNSSVKYGDVGDMPVEIQVLDYGATLTFTAGSFDTTLVSVATDKTLASGEYGKIEWIDKP